MLKLGISFTKTICTQLSQVEKSHMIYRSRATLFFVLLEPCFTLPKRYTSSPLMTKTYLNRFLRRWILLTLTVKPWDHFCVMITSLHPCNVTLATSLQILHAGYLLLTHNVSSIQAKEIKKFVIKSLLIAGAKTDSTSTQLWTITGQVVFPTEQWEECYTLYNCKSEPFTLFT